MKKQVHIQHEKTVDYGICRGAAADILATEIENDPWGLLSLARITDTDTLGEYLCVWEFIPSDEFMTGSRRIHDEQ